MTKQLELPLECKVNGHIWSGWRYGRLQDHFADGRRTCLICGESQYLVPKPSPLPVRSSFSVFLADFKAKLGW